MQLQPLDIHDPAVQEFLWAYLPPGDIRWDYTKLDAMEFLRRQIGEGNCELWGDLSVRFMLRVTIANPKVVEPHVMGDAHWLRTAMEQGAHLAWEQGYEMIRIWTPYPSIARIVERAGFQPECTLKGGYYTPEGELRDMHSLIMEKDA